ncbi:hypothetical protein HZH68_000649 [Vespula germanica]|uniref:Uncharacterized protein n=1 Tax=Vespula germanica TaxID=30212 RepID=A0A834NUA1_VESGE|nr:hypothetical protein HZH68_000649 [Vespula germanica]
MMDSADLPFAQSTSEVDNGFNGWSAPLFKVALCPPFPEPSSSPFSPPNLDLYLELLPRHSLLSISQRGKRMTKHRNSYGVLLKHLDLECTTNENKDERLTILSQPPRQRRSFEVEPWGWKLKGKLRGTSAGCWMLAAGRSAGCRVGVGKMSDTAVRNACLLDEHREL